MTDHCPTTCPAEDAPLFPGYEPEVMEPAPPLSADRRRTLRQAAKVAAGIHPLTGGPLHELASRHRDADAPRDDPFTCGSCRFREVLRYHGKSYPKCTNAGTQSAEQYERFGPPKVTHSAATDVRAWWPACRDYTPGGRLSTDAARYIPGEEAP